MTKGRYPASCCSSQPTTSSSADSTASPASIQTGSPLIARSVVAGSHGAQRRTARPWACRSSLVVSRAMAAEDRRGPRRGARRRDLVRVVGDVTPALAEVSRELTDAQRGPGAVYVDLEAVTFIDSRGLGALLAANERARGRPAGPDYRPSDRSSASDVPRPGVLTEVEELPAA